MIEAPHLQTLGNVPDPLAARVAEGIRDWLPEAVVGQSGIEGCRSDSGLTGRTPAEAAANIVNAADRDGGPGRRALGSAGHDTEGGTLVRSRARRFLQTLGAPGAL